MHIRDATPADAAAIARLLGDLGYPATEHEAAERLARFAADPASRLLVAEADGSGVVGLVATHAVPRLDGETPSCRITDIVVAEAHRRAGVGSRLVAAAERQARAIGARGSTSRRATGAPARTPSMRATASRAARAA